MFNDFSKNQKYQRGPAGPLQGRGSRPVPSVPKTESATDLVVSSFN